MFDNKLAEFNYKVLSRILACGELVSKWDNSVRSICFQCNEIDSMLEVRKWHALHMLTILHY